MYYQERKIVVNLLSSAGILMAYAIFAFTANPPREPASGTELTFWAWAILIAMAISVGVMIVTQIVFHIVLAIRNSVARELSRMAEAEGKDKPYEEIEMEEAVDERDRLVLAKGQQIALWVLSLGFPLALVGIVAGVSLVLIINGGFFVFGLSQIAGEATSLYQYRKGARNG